VTIDPLVIAWVQTCIVHQIGGSIRYVTYADRKAVARDLKVRSHREIDSDRTGEDTKE
jgi:hypothetical protein